MTIESGVPQPQPLPEGIDPDGLPNKQAIESMNSEGVAKALHKIFQDSNPPERTRNCRRFLAKVCVVAQEMGFDKKKANDLFFKAIKLYAESLEINPYEPKKQAGANEVVSGLIMSVINYIPDDEEGEKRHSDLLKRMHMVFHAWVESFQKMPREP